VTAVASSVVFAQDDFVAQLNESIRDGLAHLRRCERRYGVRYTMRFELTERGTVRMHVRPVGQDE